MRIQNQLNQLNHHGPQVQPGRVSTVGPWNDADARAVDSPVENDPSIFFLLREVNWGREPK
jgi:hypothetical protein